MSLTIYDFIKDLVSRFYRDVAGEDPDWDRIDIMHAWGGQNLEGVYYNACIDNNLQPLRLKDVQKYGKNAFNEIFCKIIAYNITVLIHAMFELGITPNFIE